MTKKSLLYNIAQTAYDIGFGGKKHFKTYDLYRIMPKTVSVITIIVGIIQLLHIYSKYVTPNVADFVSVTLIVIGIVALVVDINAENKEDYARAGKKLLALFNRLRRMYYEVLTMDESSDFSQFQSTLEEISRDAETVAISKQAIFTHWSTHIGFYKGMQSQWVVKELHLNWRDKNPIWHWETFFFFGLFALIVVVVVSLF